MNDYILRTKFWIEYDDFKIQKYELDDTIYSAYPDVTHNKHASYPIKTLGNVSSSINGDGQFVLVWPSYLKSFEEKKYDREVHHDDYMYAGFHTLDMDEDYECSREYKSGWWFPHRVRSEAKTKANTNGNCYHDTSLHTNLNGVYHQNITKNQRQISYCNSTNVEDCFDRDDGHKYKFTGLTSIKLKHTQLWLKRRRRG